MKTIVFRFILMAFSCSVAVVALELFLRTYYPEIAWGQRKDNYLGWSTDEYVLFRPKADKAQGEKRVLYLGDSFLAGSALRSLKHRFPIALHSQLPNEYTAQILATGGWGTDQQLLAFMQKGVKWEPNLVVLSFCAHNDLSNNLSNCFGRDQFKPYFVKEVNRLKLYNGYGRAETYESLFDADSLLEMYQSSARRCYIFDFIKVKISPYFRQPVDLSYEELSEAVDSRYLHFDVVNEKTLSLNPAEKKLDWSPHRGVNHAAAYLKGDYIYNNYQWELTEAIILELKTQVEKIGAKFAVLLLPVAYNPRDVNTITGGNFEMDFETPEGPFVFSSPEPSRRLKKIAEDHNLNLIDPTSEFIRHIKDNDLMEDFFPNPEDQHFSKAGHDLLAELIKPDIEKLLK